jgi:hypothetical protein
LIYISKNTLFLYDGMKKNLFYLKTMNHKRKNITFAEEKSG